MQHITAENEILFQGRGIRVQVEDWCARMKLKETYESFHTMRKEKYRLGTNGENS